ncbi:MAG: phosphate ABC transporter substrate-binding protein [Methanoregula sp.]|jgi:phosphate transport system substrate-binding protein|uniref:phosphate ABC transporter substrate-binding protein n=1 Tax=Methanoregula sp. TaxID=2052170 RepID=UPI003C178CDA
MKDKRSSLLYVTACLVALLIVSIFVAGCTNNGNSAAAPATTTSASIAALAAPAATTTPPAVTATTVSSATETLTLTGSTTVLPIAQAVADAYMQAHPEANIQVSGGGSGVGIQAIINQKVDIGMSSADVSAAQKAQDSTMNIITIAHDGIAIIVNPSNTIQDISLAQVKQIYSGNITSWNQISGAGVTGTNHQIVVVGRDSSSGTRTYFDQFVMTGTNDTMSMHEDNSNGAVAQEVAQTPGAIGYISIGYLTSDVKAVPILTANGHVIAPSVATVKDKTYPIHRDLYMITNGQPTGLAKDYIDFLLSPDGQQIVVAQGYVALNS